MSYPDPVVIRIGAQEVWDIGDRLRFVIKKVMLHRGYAFKFGIRDKVLREAQIRNKPIEFIFEQHPQIHFLNSAEHFMELGQLKNQVGYRADDPMKFYWFFVDFKKNLTKVETNKEQLQLI